MDLMSLRVTQNAYFSLLTHTKQLLLVTFCDKTAGSGVRFWTHGRQTDGWTDRRGSRNSYLDGKKSICSNFKGNQGRGGTLTKDDVLGKLEKCISLRI